MRNFLRRTCRSFIVSAFLLSILVLPQRMQAQLTVTSGVSAASLVTSLVGAGVTVANVTINCPTNAYGTFSNGNTTNLGITNGIMLTTGSCTNAIGPNNSTSAGTCNGTSANDPQLQSLDPQATFDPCIIEFDITPACSNLQIRFVFGSEEYPEFVSSGFNDAFGLFVTGPLSGSCPGGTYNNQNMATLPNNVTIASIDNVNNTTNSAYYVDNTGGATIQYDGFTTVLTRNITMCPCLTYHWKLAIADAGDCVYDSGVFIDFLACSNALTVTPSQTNTGCSTCVGTASVTLTGGNGPFTYNWSPAPGGGQGTANATGLCAGTYTCTITDGLGCTPSVTQTFTITGGGTLVLSGTQTDLTCNGVCNGSATTNIVTGTGPFTYAWAPSGGTGATASGLCAGTYTCTVTASGGCTATQIFNITQPPAITATQSQVNVSCNGGCNGSATVVASGGTGTYTYSWAPSGGTGATASGLCAGTYTCTISSPAGCSITKTFSITAPPALSTTGSQVNLTCNSVCNGSAAVTASGGTSPYTYSWAPSGGTGSTASSLCAGNYTVTVTDANGCTITRSYAITQPPVITATQSQVNVSCNGGCNGSATVVASGGNGTYTYSWAPSGGTGATASGLCAGTYTCTISSPAGCSITKTFTITAPPALSTTGSQVNVTCNGTCNGSATVTASGGTPPYTYAWTPSGGTGTTASALCAGNYTVTVTDANGCTITRSYAITQPTALSTTGSQVNVNCNGNCTGSATVTASGGTGPYTYAWAPSGGTGTTASSLCAGNYTVTVTDANGCTITRSYAITQPTALTATQSSVPATCGGNNGSATVTPSGGTGPYTYSWTPSGGTGSTASSLTAGSYTCTITDANGCVITITVTVTSTGSITAAITATVNVTCFGGNNGSATVTPSGGTAPYTYSWSPSGGTGATGINLTAGSYTVTVTDANSCVTTASVTITQPPAITNTASQINATCNGSCNGSATVVASGGTGTYTYSWAPSGGTGATASSLCAGNYTCTISSPAGCTHTQTFTITAPPALSTTGSQVNVTCNGSCTGSATVTASGGTTPYSYSWAPSGGTGSTASSLCSGNYTVTVTDANGCTITRSYAITQPTAISATSSATATTCGSFNGSASVTASGGTGPYTYSWAPSGGTGSTASSLNAGTYTCTITDANLCTFTISVIVPNAGSPSATITASTNTTCSTACNGSATVAGAGGTPPYTYAWSPSGGTATTASSLCAGTYTATVTDANGCLNSATVTITAPPVITIVPSQTNVTCFGGCNGSATVTASGGTGTYTYAWAPSGGTGATATALCVGSYTCTVSSPAGCTATQTFTIAQPTAVTASATSTPVLCNGGSTGTATVTASGGTGPYTYSWTPSGGTGSVAAGLNANTYTCTVTDANGCTATTTTTVTQPSALAASTTFVSATCGSANGSASVTASGGTGPYTYSWAPSGGTGTTASGLIAGGYTVTVTDANSCTTTAVANVPNAGSPTITITATVNVSCFGGNNGSLTSSSSGGTGPYTYAWSPSGGTGLSGTALIAGNYTVTVTDANGCTATASATVTQPTALTASATSTPVLCNGGSTGTATVTASGGTPVYTYSWAPSGGTSVTASALNANTYTCTVTDANGCTTTATTIVTQPTALTTTSSQVDENCNGGNTGSATVTPGGGTGPYTYSWAPSGGTGSTASNLTAQGYTCTITDANGCTLTQAFTITEPSALSLTTTFTQATCGAANGSATVTITGGTPTYTQSWAPSGGTGTIASGLLAGTYTVTVVDFNGCTATATANVPNAGSPTLVVSNAVDVLCNGGTNGSIDVIASNGTGPYTYSWSPSGGTSATASGLGANSYTCTVTDANGCTATASATITEPSALTISGSSTNVDCFGNATGTASVTVGGGASGYIYNWSPSGGSAANATALLAGGYTCTVTDANGCIITQSVNITEPPQLAVAIAGFNVSCFNSCDGQVVVIPSGGVPNYLTNWNTGCTSLSCNNICAGSYTCTVTDANGCVSTATTTVTQPTAITMTTSAIDAHCNQADGSASANANGGTGTLTYQWIGGPTGQNYNNIPANTYSVIVTDQNNCADTASVTVNNLNGVVASVGPTSNILCFGNSTGNATINTAGGNGPYNYQWTPNVSVVSSASNIPAGTYQVLVTDADGCTSTVTITLTEPTQLGLTASANPPAMCNGGSTSIDATANGGTPGYTYSWNPGALSGTPQTIAPSANTTYTAYVTDANGCIDSATVAVTINPVPVAGLVSNLQSGCEPLCVLFSDISTVSNPGQITSWNWDFGDGNTSTQQNPQHCFSAAGQYTIILTVTTADGCTNTITMTNYINVFANPVAGFTASPQPTTVLDPMIFFTDTSTNANQWDWSFGDATLPNSSLQNPSVTYPAATCYQVVLTVTSVDGCVDTATSVVCIGPDATLFVPNAFTPNDDGKNDAFMPVGIGIDPDHFEMWIFDRWGNMIYYTDDMTKGWDGRVQGHTEICQIDTYVWKIKAIDVTGTKHNLIGKVSLIK